MPYSVFQRSSRLHPQLAVALKHELGKPDAPRVVASGRGLLADRMIAKAKENGIPIHQDDGLARLLSEVPVPSTIPTELFEAVARVLAFIYRVDGRLK
jgi:flagellar biosynthesis protein